MFSTDRLDVLMVGDSRSTHCGQQGRLYPHRQEESPGNVPQFRFGQSDIPVRRIAEEIPVGPMREADASKPLT